ncbi:MAG: hypothetical protein JSU07_14030 [Bacteroidetes bacterium]|nr:hypothetical protein [Bacteroidota bacterium]
MAANVLALGEGGDFQHQISYEAPKFKFKKNCPTKNVTATFAKPVLPAYPFSFGRHSVRHVSVTCPWYGRCVGCLFFFEGQEKNFKIHSAGKGGSSFASLGLRVDLCGLQMCLHLCVSC